MDFLLKKDRMPEGRKELRFLDLTSLVAMGCSAGGEPGRDTDREVSFGRGIMMSGTFESARNCCSSRSDR